MNIGALLFGAAMLVPAAIFVIGPLLDPQSRKAPVLARKPDPTQVSDEPAPALLSLRDLDFDYQIGKVSQDDYTALRAQLAVQAAHELETIQKEKEDILEEQIRRRKEKNAGTVFCPSCGKKIRPLDTFCSGCGKALKGDEKNSS